jgi:5-methylcytosine-specific restriction endonuclease McrA
VSDFLPAREPDWVELKLDANHPLVSRKLWTELVKLRARYCCEDCGVRGRGPIHGDRSGTTILHAHHIDGLGHLGRLHDRLNNGRALCRSCHRKEHGRMGRAARAAA